MSFDKRDYIVPDEVKANYISTSEVASECFDEESPNDDMRQIALTIYRALQNRRDEMYVCLYDTPNYRSLVSYLQRLNPEFKRAY
jgi:hypothetical protein